MRAQASRRSSGPTSGRWSSGSRIAENQVLQHVAIEVRRDAVDACVRFYELIGFRRVDPPKTLRDRAEWVEREGTQVHLMFADDPVVPPSGHHAVVLGDYDTTL